MNLVLAIPDAVAAAITESDAEQFLILELTCALFSQDKLSWEQASEMCGMSQIDFLREVRRRGITKVSSMTTTAADRSKLQAPRLFGCAPSLVMFMAEDFNAPVDDFGDL